MLIVGYESDRRKGTRVVPGLGATSHLWFPTVLLRLKRVFRWVSDLSHVLREVLLLVLSTGGLVTRDT